MKKKYIKILSVGLVVVMLLSFCVIGVSAKDYVYSLTYYSNDDPNDFYFEQDNEAYSVVRTGSINSSYGVDSKRFMTTFNVPDGGLLNDRYFTFNLLRWTNSIESYSTQSGYKQRYYIAFASDIPLADNVPVTPKIWCLFSYRVGRSVNVVRANFVESNIPGIDMAVEGYFTVDTPVNNTQYVLTFNDFSIHYYADRGDRPLIGGINYALGTLLVSSVSDSKEDSPTVVQPGTGETGYVYDQISYPVGAGDFNLYIDNKSVSKSLSYTYNPLNDSNSRSNFGQYYTSGGLGEPNDGYYDMLISSNSSMSGYETKKGYIQRYYLNFASSFPISSNVPVTPKISCEFHYKYKRQRFSVVADLTPSDLKTVSFPVEGYFTAEVFCLNGDYTFDGFTIHYYTGDGTVQYLYSFCLGNMLVYSVTTDKNDAPIFQTPDYDILNDYINIDGSVNDLMSDVGGHYGDFIGDIDAVISKPEYSTEITFLRSWLTSFMGISVVGDLLVVAVIFGLITVFINIANSISKNSKKR